MKNLTITAALRERGISLIEGVLYLVIALAVIVGGIVFFQQAQLSNAVTDTARAGVSISSETRALYQSQRDFGTDELTEALISAGAVPSNFQNAAGDAIVHPFGGDIRVFGNEDNFVVAYENLSEAACLRLGSVGEGGQGQLGTGILGANFSSDTLGENVTFSSELDEDAPITASDLSEECEDNVTVSVFYSR